jgi:hypothetical protein
VNLISGSAANAVVTVVRGSHEFQADVNLMDDAVVDVASGATLVLNNNLNLAGNTLTKTGAGELAINNRLISAGGTFNCNEGVCSGAGFISGDVNNDGGTISPVNSPGVMAIAGNFAQSAGSTLSIELGGTTSGTEHDQLLIDGAASIDGTLEVSLVDGFQPTLGDAFDVLDFGSLTGGFHTITLPELTGGLAWDDSAIYATGTLAVVPEPASLVLLVVACVVLVAKHCGRTPVSFDTCLYNQSSTRRFGTCLKSRRLRERSVAS